MTLLTTEQIATQRDLAVPAEIIEIISQNEFMRTATVKCANVVSKINLAYTPEASVGDHVIVHAGFAISIVTAQESVRLLADLQKLVETPPFKIEMTSSNTLEDRSAGKVCLNNSLNDDDDPQYGCLCC